MKRLLQASIIASVLCSSFLVLGCGTADTDTEIAVQDSGTAAELPNSGQQVQSVPRATDRAKAHRDAPEFSLASLTGDRVQLSDHRGEVVLVDFWATWCGPCRRTIPDLIGLYQDHNPSGFTILGVALERQGTERLIPYVKNNSIPYPILIGDREAVQSFGGFNSIPTAFLIGRDGTVRQKIVGAQPRSVLEKAIQELLAEPPPA